VFIRHFPNLSYRESDVALVIVLPLRRAALPLLLLQQLAAKAFARCAVAQHLLAEGNSDAGFLTGRRGLARVVIAVPARQAKTLAFEVGFG
jgi:hypothetical protein